MKSEELARVCFAARPLLWAVGIVVVIVAVVWALPKLQIAGQAPATPEGG